MLRIAVFIKQVPKVETLALDAQGRLQRAGLETEINAYCRRAISKGVALAREYDGHTTVVSLGPSPATDALREALAWGADDAVLVTDPAFAGSDTLATARALNAAAARLGEFDLLLVGRNSVDADTGQVGPELAELMGLPFAAGVREISLEVGDRGPTRVIAHCEHDDGWEDVEVTLPAVLSTAERLCEPAKVKPDVWAGIPVDRVRTLSAADLGDGPWGQAGSPTSVGAVRVQEHDRRRIVLDGDVESQVDRAVALLREFGALDEVLGDDVSATVPAGPAGAGRLIAVLLEPERPGAVRELLGAAASLAVEAGAPVAAVGVPGEPARTLASWGADEIVALAGSDVEEDVAAAVASWCHEREAWAVLAPGTLWGREVAARVAARLGAGLTGDAVDLDVDGDRLVCWKPAFGGRMVAAVTASTPVQLATVRPGVLPILRPRPVTGDPQQSSLDVESRSRLRVLSRSRDDDLDDLAHAQVVIGVGQGVPPGAYADLEPLRTLLGAEIAGTRKVTDKGWLPRARQVGLTGRSIAPRLYVAIGTSGKYNHLVGVRNAGTILAINDNPEALVFDSADIGIVGDWRSVVERLTMVLAEEEAAKESVDA